MWSLFTCYTVITLYRLVSGLSMTTAADVLVLDLRVSNVITLYNRRRRLSLYLTGGHCDIVTGL